MHFAFIFSEYSRLLFPKRLWKWASTISFRKYKRKVVLLVIYLFNYDSSKSTFFMLKELRNYKRKIGENTTNILKLLFFIINVHFVTWNQLSTSRKLNFPLTSSVYFVFFRLEMQKRLKQTKAYHAFSHFVWKETTHKLLKVPAARTLFFSVYVIATTCFDECFLFCVIPEIHCFSWKFIVAPRLF